MSNKTIKFIEQKTRCSINELRTLPLNEAKELMLERGAMKKPNVIKQWLADKYKTIGKKLGLLKKEHNFYTHID